MARHTIQIPINKSSNANMSNGVVTYLRRDRYEDELDIQYINPVSNSLYCVRSIWARDGATGRYYPDGLFTMALGWDGSLIPSDKVIVRSRLYLYTLQPHSEAVRYKFAEFSEGSNMPSNSPADGVQTGGMSSGWGYVEITELKGDSVVIRADLKQTGDIYGPDQNGDRVYGQVWETYSHRNSTNKPYLEVVYDDIPPEKPTSLYPDNITLNPRDIIRFAWEHNSEEKTLQKGFTLQYKINSGAWVTITETTPNQFYDMPASTLPTTGTVTWQVKTTDINNETSTYSDSYFTLGIVPQKAPIPVAPISQYIDESNDVKFEWNFTGGSPSETQSKFDLQYSTNGGTSWTTKTVTETNVFYVMEKGILSTGNITWRIRTYNNWNEVSPYSETRSFTIIGSPPIPLITEVTNSGRPIIGWQSQGQHLYEIQVLKDNIVIFNSGTIPSTSDKEYKLKDYLKDGNYKVKLKVFNEFNLESPWAEKTFTISTVKPLKPIIEIYSSEYSITMKGSELSYKNLIYRDNILIGEVKGNQFIDYTGKNNKEYKYFIRAIDLNDNFEDSEIELGKCSFKNNTLATLNNPGEYLKLKYGFGSIPGKSNIIKNIGTLNYYDGREYPIAEFTEFKNLEKSLSFFLKEIEEKDKLIELINQKKVLLYRDFDGENIKGIIFGTNISKNEMGYNVSFTITKTEV